ALAGNLDARHLIADLQRQIEAGGGLAGALGNGELGFAERLATTRESFDGARAGAIGHAQHVRGKPAAIALCLPKCKRSVLLLGPQHSEASRRASKLAQRGRERIAFAVVEAVGKPDHAEASLVTKLLLKGCRQRCAIRRVRLRRKAADALTRLIG